MAIDTVRCLASETHASFVEQHNAYTAYLAFFLLATTGLRAVSSLLPARFDVDGTTGLCFVSDKDNHAYEQARIVWLHPALLRQLDEYRAHVTRLRQYLALVSLQGISHLDGQAQTPRPGEAINAALGHGERGEAPWGSLSSLPPIPWRRRLGSAFVQIITDAGFEVLSSPLLRSTGRP